jgi:hypothetical protein
MKREGSKIFISLPLTVILRTLVRRIFSFKEGEKGVEAIHELSIQWISES